MLGIFCLERWVGRGGNKGEVFEILIGKYG